MDIVEEVQRLVREERETACVLAWIIASIQLPNNLYWFASRLCLEDYQELSKWFALMVNEWRRLKNLPELDPKDVVVPYVSETRGMDIGGK